MAARQRSLTELIVCYCAAHPTFTGAHEPTGHCKGCQEIRLLHLWREHSMDNPNFDTLGRRIGGVLQ